MKSLQEFIIESETPAKEFAILKPGFTNKENEFEELLNNRGWRVVQKKKQTLSKQKVEDLYKMHKNKSFYPALINYMSSAPCICYSLASDDDTKKDPIKDMDKIKDDVRKAWGEDEMKNAMHSSDSEANVERETNICLGQ